MDLHLDISKAYVDGRTAEEDIDDLSNLKRLYKIGWVLGRADALAVVGDSPALHGAELARKANVGAGDIQPYVSHESYLEWRDQLQQACDE